MKNQKTEGRRKAAEKFDHFGLEFALAATPEEIENKVRELESPNRIKITDRDRVVLRVGLRERMKVRDRKVAERLEWWPK